MNYAIFLKISCEMLDDLHSAGRSVEVENLIRYYITKHKISLLKKSVKILPGSTVIGFYDNGDDFVKNTKTTKIDFKVFKVPRILNPLRRA